MKISVRGGNIKDRLSEISRLLEDRYGSALQIAGTMSVYVSCKDEEGNILDPEAEYEIKNNELIRKDDSNRTIRLLEDKWKNYLPFLTNQAAELQHQIDVDQKYLADAYSRARDEKRIKDRQIKLQIKKQRMDEVENILKLYRKCDRERNLVITGKESNIGCIIFQIYAPNKPQYAYFLVENESHEGKLQYGLPDGQTETIMRAMFLKKYKNK